MVLHISSVVTSLGARHIYLPESLRTLQNLAVQNSYACFFLFVTVFPTNRSLKFSGAVKDFADVSALTSILVACALDRSLISHVS